LKYSADAAFNPAIPAAVVIAVEAVEKKFAAGELKIKVTKEDAHGGI